MESVPVDFALTTAAYRRNRLPRLPLFRHNGDLRATTGLSPRGRHSAGGPLLGNRQGRRVDVPIGWKGRRPLPGRRKNPASRLARNRGAAATRLPTRLRGRSRRGRSRGWSRGWGGYGFRWGVDRRIGRRFRRLRGWRLDRGSKLLQRSGSKNRPRRKRMKTRMVVVADRFRLDDTESRSQTGQGAEHASPNRRARPRVASRSATRLVDTHRIGCLQRRRSHFLHGQEYFRGASHDRIRRKDHRLTRRLTRRLLVGRLTTSQPGGTVEFQ